MFLLAFYAFLRIGEKTSTGKNNQHFLLRKHAVSNYNDTIQLTFSHFKYNNSPSDTLTIIMNSDQPELCAVTSLNNYLALRKHDSDSEPLNSFMDGRPVSRQYFTNQLKLSLKWAGLSLDRYKAHSFRIRAATTAASRGISEETKQLMGRWKSNAFKNVRIPLLHL